jgi:hypothetical protein
MQDGFEQEYSHREFFECDTVAGCADKCIFQAKEMVS